MRLWPFSRPRLRDVEECQPELQKSGKVLFFAPHTSERMATLPLISRLSKGLGEAGLECQTHSIDDMNAQVLSVSAHLSSERFSRRERKALDGMFRLKDAMTRLSIACRMLIANPDALLLEMHALDRDYRESDRFEGSGYFYRIPGSRVLYLRDYEGEYAGPVRRGLRLLGEEGGRGLAEAKAVLCLDGREISESALTMLSILRLNLQRAALIEIPAPAVHENEDERFGAGTRFEKTYALSASLKHTLGEEDIAALMRAIV